MNRVDSPLPGRRPDVLPQQALQGDGRPVPDPGHLPATWAALSGAAAALSTAGCVVALARPGAVYDRETVTMADAATAQDLTGLVVAPILLVLTYAAWRGHLRAWLALLGVLAFTVYNYTIYVFSLTFGPLFLVWVAVWGLSLYALIGGMAALRPAVVSSRFAQVGVRLPGWFLIGMAAVFCALWLREIVPDLLAGRPSTSAAEWQVPTNPVHVLDLGFFLPAVSAGGVLLLRRQAFGVLSAIGLLVFLELTCLAVILNPLVANAHGHTPGWSVLAPIGVVAVATLIVMVRLVRSVRVTRPDRTPGRSTDAVGPLVPVPGPSKPLASS